MTELEMKKFIRDLERTENNLWSRRHEKNFSWRDWYSTVDKIAEFSIQTEQSKNSVRRVFQQLKHKG